jgi:hypothetical protein
MSFRRIYTHEAEANFWAKVERRGPDECWPWLGAMGSNGYGRFRVPILGVEHAHRVALALSLGRGIIGAFACHRCDNKPCCNPAHLYEGNHESNTRDAIERHRFVGRGNRLARFIEPKRKPHRRKVYLDPPIR